MKLIALTQGKFTKVDDADFEFLNKWKWFAYKNKNDRSFYARRTAWNKSTKKHEIIAMHRLLMEVTDSNVLVDHKDMDGLNNQRG